VITLSSFHCISLIPTFHYRLGDYREELLLSVHRIFICTVSTFLSSWYCAKDLGFCRPQPMFFYLQNDWKENDFKREPVSIAIVAIVILTILTLQGLIEIKKHKANLDGCHAEDIAAAANTNLENAKLKLNLESGIEICDLESSPELFDIGSKPHSCLPTVVSVQESKKTKNGDFSSSHYTLIAARAITIFAFSSATIFCVFFSLENAGDWRPHGAAASSMILFGILAPSVFYIRNAKMRHFANNYLKEKLKRCKIKRTSQRIVTIV
jgi:hypothetical protein